MFWIKIFMQSFVKSKKSPYLMVPKEMWDKDLRQLLGGLNDKTVTFCRVINTVLLLGKK